ncbi:uncharacterized protein LOC127131565 [Lathyrus oleraceus]|uniref:uncharacterized protein LOC127131565 n=1 Tax=Pisum sativum TaxID=3888 RepID=UPI0021CF35C9|nr:uncharacterized protein LOC127131565 [Pisum sativum]
MNINAPFGGKIMIMGGDFRQVLPVIEKGSRGQMISACIVRSQLWVTIKILHLRQNMRSIHDHEFAQFLMRIGDGNEPAKEDDMVKMPAEIVIPWEGESSIKKLIQHTFPQLENHGWDASYMVERVILTPKNCDVHMLNEMIINKFPEDEHIFLCFDEVEGDTHNLYQQEYSHTIAHDTLPPHILKIKIGAPLMLLRNIDPKFGQNWGVTPVTFDVAIDWAYGENAKDFMGYIVLQGRSKVLDVSPDDSMVKNKLLTYIGEGLRDFKTQLKHDYITHPIDEDDPEYKPPYWMCSFIDHDGSEKFIKSPTTPEFLAKSEK